MNKKICEATKEDIILCYQNNCISNIHNYRKHSIIYEWKDYELGELKPICRFSLGMAQRYNLGLEFRLWNSNKKRKERLKDKVEDIVKSGKAIFITMTFKDSELEKTSSETRRRKIARYLKQECERYVANIDFGVDPKYTQREHYHAIAIPKNEKISFQSYCDMFDGSRISSLQIRQSDKSNISLSLYINKLTNHAYKSFGFAKRLIYSRN